MKSLDRKIKSWSREELESRYRGLMDKYWGKVVDTNATNREIDWLTNRATEMYMQVAELGKQVRTLSQTVRGLEQTLMAHGFRFDPKVGWVHDSLPNQPLPEPYRPVMDVDALRREIAELQARAEEARP